MRSREDILGDWHGEDMKDLSRVVELLLDIREILVKGNPPYTSI
jgi:hypothetical protein